MYLVATLEIATAEIMAKDGILLWWVGTKLAVKWRARITLACRKRRRGIDSQQHEYYMCFFVFWGVRYEQKYA
jgi:hypothetical protein